MSSSLEWSGPWMALVRPKRLHFGGVIEMDESGNQHGANSARLPHSQSIAQPILCLNALMLVSGCCIGVLCSTHLFLTSFTQKSHLSYCNLAYCMEHLKPICSHLYESLHGVEGTPLWLFQLPAIGLDFHFHMHYAGANLCIYT